MKDNIPGHIAIIMDGNGRWAEDKGLPRTAGHRQGILRVREVVNTASDIGVRVLTLFAFSSENWKRPRREVDMLMHALVAFLGREIESLHKKNIRFLVIGREDPLPEYVLKKLRQAQYKTKGNTGLTVVLALNYGSRQEIVDAAVKFAGFVSRGQALPRDLDIEKFGSLMYTRGIPDPDLLIRTSGEMRLSNFLLWQLSYAELYFPRKCWPDFKAEDFLHAIKVYQRRERRFGSINGEKKNN